MPVIRAIAESVRTLMCRRRPERMSEKDELSVFGASPHCLDRLCSWVVLAWHHWNTLSVNAGSTGMFSKRDMRNPFSVPQPLAFCLGSVCGGGGDEKKTRHCCRDLYFPYKTAMFFHRTSLRTTAVALRRSAVAVFSPGALGLKNPTSLSFSAEPVFLVVARKCGNVRPKSLPANIRKSGVIVKKIHGCGTVLSTGHLSGSLFARAVDRSTGFPSHTKASRASRLFVIHFARFG